MCHVVRSSCRGPTISACASSLAAGDGRCQHPGQQSVPWSVAERSDTVLASLMTRKHHSRHQMRVAVLRETYEGERRVALVPAVVPSLTKLGLEVVVQAGAGAAAGFADAAYEQ